MRPGFRRVVVVLAVAIAAVRSAAAGEGLCTSCGRHAECQKVSRLVVEQKKVEVVCWGSQCEEFSVPGPSRPGSRNCEAVCGSTDEGSKRVCACPKKFVWTEWIPGHAQVRTRQKLMKKTVTKTVPSHKWVVEDLCSECVASRAGSQPGLEVPQPRLADTKQK